MAQAGNAADSAVQGDRVELVFVYGSLKRGMANHHHMAAAVFQGTAWLQGLALFDLGPFPMAIASGDPGHKLLGELYGVGPTHLAALDRFEGTPRLYRRQCWPLADDRNVWVYLGRPQQVRFVSRLADGIWRQPSRVSQRDQPASPGRQNQRQH
jgi:gamma-glutamylcyclotransferase (GGCT)/AIG2-like uncharacterized protein YtfP